MWRYVQMSFRDNMTLSDPRHVRRKLNAAASELADMNSLHDMRQAPIPHQLCPRCLTIPVPCRSIRSRDAQSADTPSTAPAAPSAPTPAEQPSRSAAPQQTAPAAESPTPQPAGHLEPGGVEGSDGLPSIVRATIRAAESQRFFERAMEGEDCALSSAEVMRHWRELHAEELAAWRERSR